MDNNVCTNIRTFILKLSLKIPIFLLISILFGARVNCADQNEPPTVSTKNCGTLDLVPTDVRTFAPWTVAIFRRVGNSSNHRWSFHASGTVFAPGQVHSTQAGPLGRFPSDKDPRNFLVVAGVNTSDFYKHDEFAQYSRVTFVQPLDFMAIQMFKSFYHEVVYYLTSPLDLSTPFVKAACVPFFIANPRNQYLRALRAAINAGIPVPAISSGFASGRADHVSINATRSTTGREWTLKIWKLTALPGKVCSSIFRSYYGQSWDTFCYRKTTTNPVIFSGVETLSKANFPPEYNQHDDKLCFAPGMKTQGVIATKWFVGGVSALIPGRKRNRCDDKTVYFSAVSSSDPADYVSYVQFIAKMEKCGDDKFACASLHSNQCIFLNQTCDNIPDCEDESDEHPKNCAWKIGQVEIKPEEIKTSIELDPRDVARRCPEFEFIPDGVRCVDLESLENVQCNSHFYPGRRIRIECDQFYTAAKNSFDHMDLFCNFDAEWIGHRPIFCQKECGIFDERDNLSKNFPWEIKIFENDTEICGGTLIQSDFVLTDGRCVKNWIESPISRSTIPISLAEDIFLGHSKVPKLQIRNSWVSSDSGALEDKYENGVALIQLLKPVELRAKDLNPVMAACFLVPPFNKIQLQQVAMIGQEKVVVVSNEQCDVVKPEEFCTTLSLKKESDTFGREGIKIGAGLFLKRVEASTRKSKHVLQGIFSGVTKDGRGAFKNVDSYADWILDILEANS